MEFFVYAREAHPTDSWQVDAYGAAPVRRYVIGEDGVITYYGGAGPHFLDLDDWSEAIKSTIS